MVYSESKQPILVYVIPFLFITTWIVAGIRGEWRNKLSLDSSLEVLDIDNNIRSKNMVKSDSEIKLDRGTDRFSPKTQEELKNSTEFQKFEDDTDHAH